MVETTVKSKVSDESSTVTNQNGKRGGSNNDRPSKKTRIHGLYRQPTVSELNRLHETENLFNSNLFRLQVEEVLQEVKVSEKVASKFQKWFEAFKTDLLLIPERKDYDLSENALFKELKVKIPIGGLITKTKCSFAFHKFTDVSIVGSFAINSAINSKLCVDLVIDVPAKTYTKNDSLNYRYHKKRAAYLACIAAHIKNMDSVSDLQYAWQNALESKPYLTFKPNSKLGNFVQVKLQLSFQEKDLKLQRFSPERNNLRESWIFDIKNVSGENDPATPFYNSSILYDLTSSINNEYIKKILGNGENLKQALVLVKIWLRQRKLDVSGFIVNMFLAHLVEMKRINNVMSSYQIVRNVWISLKTSEWDTKGVSINKTQESTPSLSKFFEHFPVVFVDKSGFYNICWQMTIGTYNALKRESALAMEMLDNSNINSFIPLFMTSFHPILQFDHILRFTNITATKEAILSRASVAQKLNYGIDNLHLAINIILSILTKGLGNRAVLIQPLTKSEFNWSVKTGLDKARLGYEEELSFGLILDGENAMQNIIKGPSANLPEADEFRTFWGDKSGLRRFQDGSMTETCYWEADSLAQMRNITKQIVQYLLEFKFGLSMETFYISNQLDSVLISKQYAPINNIIGTGEELTIKVLHAFDELKRDLRALTDLPLEINSIYGTSPVFSYMDPLPPMSRSISSKTRKRGSSQLIREKHEDEEYYKCPPYTGISTAVIELGHSGKWPGNIEAFRCLKAAFHLQISELLTQQYSLPTQPNPGFIDVLKHGFNFRLEIVHSKEITLLKRSVENGVVKHRVSEESTEMLCKGILLPKLRGSMHGLHQKYPAYGPTTSLLKRFLSSHLIDSHHFPEIVTELLVGSVFLTPEPFSGTFSPLTGFLRVLHLIFTKDWKDPLVVNFNDELRKEQIMELERNFRESDCSKPAMYIITPCDGDTPSIWSTNGPTPNVLARVIILAKTAFSYIEKCLLKDSKQNVMNAFLPITSGYDVTIHLHSELVPRSAERVNELPKLLPESTPDAEDIIPVLDFNPVQKYLKELRCAYSEFALFFHDMYGGDAIAVLWKPDVKQSREFQITNAQALKPITVNGETEHIPNIEAIVEDFKILGEGLVKNITVHY